MPKQKITRDMVVEAAFALARENGLERVTVKDIAASLGCSVQPIYSYCQSMDGLRKAVAQRCGKFIREYMARHIDRENLFQSTGRAYVQLAKDEPQIFRIFLFQERENIGSLERLYACETDSQMADFISKELNVSPAKAKTLHLNMLIYTMGIGMILSGTKPGIPAEEIFAQQDSAYAAFLAAALEERV